MPTTYYGTNVIACILPNTSDDTFPTHDEEFGKGGWRTVGTITERNAIPASRRKEGMPCVVLSDGVVYWLRGGIADANWTPLEIGASAGDLSAYLPKPTTPVNTALAVSVNGSGVISFVAAALATDLTNHTSANGTSGVHGATAIPIAGHIVKYDSQGRLTANPTQAGDDGSVLVTKGYLGTVATLNAGTSPGDVPTVDLNGKLPSSVIPTQGVGGAVASVNNETGEIVTVKQFDLTADGSSMEYTVTHNLSRSNLQVSFMDTTATPNKVLFIAWELVNVNSIKILPNIVFANGRKIRIFIS